MLLKLDLPELGLTTSPFRTRQFTEAAREAIVDEGCREKGSRQQKKREGKKSRNQFKQETKTSIGFNPQAHPPPSSHITNDNDKKGRE